MILWYITLACWSLAALGFLGGLLYERLRAPSAEYEQGGGSAAGGTTFRWRRKL